MASDGEGAVASNGEWAVALDDKWVVASDGERLREGLVDKAIDCA